MALAKRPKTMNHVAKLRRSYQIILQSHRWENRFHSDWRFLHGSANELVHLFCFPSSATLLYCFTKLCMRAHDFRLKITTRTNECEN